MPGLDGIKVLVCGGREYKNERVVRSVLDMLHDLKPIGVIIHGDAKGADSLGKDWATINKIEHDPYPADWENINVSGALVRTRPDGSKYNALAGIQRNKKMFKLTKPDYVIGFPGGTGTANMLMLSTKARTKTLHIAEISPHIIEITTLLNKKSIIIDLTK